jgi:uncharacterized protein YgbK (DUF1537 family)
VIAGVTLDDLAALAPPWGVDPLPDLRALCRTSKVIVLDDDPTGTQTVCDVPVLTRWDHERLGRLLDEPEAAAYLLTNSRSRPSEAAATEAAAIGGLLKSTRRADRPWSVVSRSDSTLRGHFPAEVDGLAAGLGVPDARVLLAPYFGDGGRVTVHGSHYLRRDAELIPVADTEFARDPVFGYRSSVVVDWVRERDPSRVEVRSLHIEEIRERGPDAVRDRLLALSPRGVLVVDAVEERDIEVVALGAAQAEVVGLPLIARTAASYVRARAGYPPVAPVPADRLHAGAPGLVVVGSHVPTSTAQLERLLEEPPIPVAAVEVSVPDVIPPADPAAHVVRMAREADLALGAGQTPVIWTSRALVRGADRSADLVTAAQVSGVLVDVVRRIQARPAWLIAKGGITSSDIATRALGVHEAQVLGPLLPGVPVWRTGAGARFPGLDLVVFPGNVGERDALRAAVARLSGVDR